MFIREFVLKIKVAIVYAILKKLSNYSTISYERVSYIKCKSLFEEKQNEREQFELLLQEKNTPYVNQLLYRINENQNILGKVLYHLVRKFWKPMDTLFFHTAQIGEGLLINHGFSTIITAKSIGRNCLINQQVTIGVKNPGRGVPRIGNNVYIGCGAKILGDIIIGDNCIIGANAVVIKDVPAKVCVGGIPARTIYELTEEQILKNYKLLRKTSMF